jgi:hypothetical protein
MTLYSKQIHIHLTLARVNWKGSYRGDSPEEVFDVLLNFEFRTNGMGGLGSLVGEIFWLRMTDIDETFLQEYARIVFH